MEIIVHIIKDLNRFLDLQLYILVDSERICLMCFGTKDVMRSFPATTSLELYKYLLDLKKLIVSWDNNRILGRVNTAQTLRNQILFNYRFDINKHFNYNKYGTN